MPKAECFIQQPCGQTRDQRGGGGARTQAINPHTKKKQPVGHICRVVDDEALVPVAILDCGEQLLPGGVQQRQIPFTFMGTSWGGFTATRVHLTLETCGRAHRVIKIGTLCAVIKGVGSTSMVVVIWSATTSTNN